MNELLNVVAQVRYKIILMREMLQLYNTVILERAHPEDVDKALHEFLVECEKLVLNAAQEKLNVPDALQRAREIKSQSKTYAMKQLGINLIDMA